MKKYMISFIILFFYISGYAFDISEADSLIIAVSTNKNEYLIYEPIFFNVYTELWQKRSF